MASLGERMRTDWPRTRISPVSGGSAPKMERSSSVRPLPTSPATPTISPGRTSNEIPRRWPLRPRSLTDSRGSSPGSGRERAKTWSMSRPTMARMISSVESLVGRYPAEDVLAVAQHGHRGRDLAYLLETVADEDEADALGHERADQIEGQVHLLGREGRGGLVEDDEACVEGDGLGDLDQLLLHHRQRAHLGARRDEPTDAHALEQLGDAPVDTTAIEEPEASVGTVLVDEDVLGHAQVRDERELLEDGGDTGHPSGVGVVEADRLTEEGDTPLVGVLSASDDLDERGLASAVLAEQGMDLARVDRQVNVVESLDTGVVLADVDGVEQRLPELDRLCGLDRDRPEDRFGRDRQGLRLGCRRGPGHDTVLTVSEASAARCGTMTKARPGAPVPALTLMGAKKKVTPAWSRGMAARLARHSR